MYNNTQHAKLLLTPHHAVEERLRNVSHECVPRGISSPLITTYVFMLGVECEDLRREAVRLPEAQGQRDLQWLHWRNVSLITQNGVPNWGEDSEERSLGEGGEKLSGHSEDECLSVLCQPHIQRLPADGHILGDWEHQWDLSIHIFHKGDARLIALEGSTLSKEGHTSSSSSSSSFFFFFFFLHLCVAGVAEGLYKGSYLVSHCAVEEPWWD